MYFLWWPTVKNKVIAQLNYSFQGLNIVHGDITTNYVPLNGNILVEKWKNKVVLECMTMLIMLEIIITMNAQ